MIISPHPKESEYIDRTSIEDDRDTIGWEGNTIHVKKNQGVIIDIYTNLLRNDTAHHFTPHQYITNSYRYSRNGITKSYRMTDEEGVGVIV